MSIFNHQVVAVVALALLPCVGMAQQANPGNTLPTERESAPRPAGNIDQIIGRMLIDANQNEITMSRFGMQRASTDEVRRFAQHMVDEHSKYIVQVQRAMGLQPPAEAQAGQAIQAPGQQPGQAHTVERRPVHEHGQAAVSQGFDFLRLKHQVGQQKLTLIQRDLAEHQGLPFDKAFVGHELAAHFDMLAALLVLDDFASPDLQPLLRQAAETTREHIQMAKRVMAGLEQSGGRAAQRPRAGGETHEY